MENNMDRSKWEWTEEWCRYSSEAPSVGATLRVVRKGQAYLLVRADCYTGEFSEVLSHHTTMVEATSAMYTEAHSC